MQRVYVAFAIVILVVGGYFFYTSRQPSTQEASAQFNLNLGPDASATPQTAAPSTPVPQTATPMFATIDTNYGSIEIKLDPSLAPTAASNFEKLAQAGFYDGTRFHRVIKNFMIQGGDPLSKDVTKKALWGTGGPGYTFPDEITANSRNVAGSVAMANSGPNTNGSQFYINAVDNSSLDGHYVVFGSVVSGMDVVTKINSVPTDSSDRPLQDVIVSKVTISSAQ